jgi:hypothetical protein
MWINLKLIQWIKNNKALIKHYNVCFQVVKGLINRFEFFFNLKNSQKYSKNILKIFPKKSHKDYKASSYGSCYSTCTH